MSDQIYSARYSGVDVYELIHPTGSIMKRVKDNWVNATHILKAANFAKAKRTRILEKEVLQEIHEKVQGGFGKYQGTWVPLNVAIRLAEKFDVYSELQPLFDYIQKDGAPPPPKAPKHHHASKADGRKRATKSASMSAISERSRTLTGTNAANNIKREAVVASSSPSMTNSQRILSTSTETTVTNPVVTRRRGRPPLSSKPNKKLSTALKRSRSDMGYVRNTVPNKATLPQIQTDMLQPLEEINSQDNGPFVSHTIGNMNHNGNINSNNETIRKSVNHNDNPHSVPLTPGSQFLLSTRTHPHFKELEINDGLSSDIEPSHMDGDNMQTNDFQQIQQQQLQRVHGPGSSNASSPSLPTSPGQLDDTHAFDDHNYGVHGTSPIVSTIPKYDSQPRPQTSDINDSVNKYLSKLVDYFISNDIKSNKKIPIELLSPPMNSAPYIDVPIDPELHNAFHWACSMGTLPIIEALYQVGTSPRSENALGQTPLMRSAMFHNSYTKRSFPKIFQLLQETVFDVDSSQQTVIHQIVKRKSTTPSAVYYLDIVLSKIKDFASRHRIQMLLNAQDKNGDTALHIAAKNGDKTFFNTLIDQGASGTIPNKEGLTSNEIMNRHYEERYKPRLSMNDNVKNYLLEDGLMTMGITDFPMYPSNSATKLARGIPSVVNSMKEFSEKYNKNFENRANELKVLERTLNNIKNNTSKIDNILLELLGKNSGNGNDKDTIDRIVISQNESMNITRQRVNKLEHNLQNRYEKIQSYRLRSLLNNQNEGDVTDDDDEHKEHDMNKHVYVALKRAIRLSQYQLKRKSMINKLLILRKGNDNIPKYRKMISQGTEISPDEIDEWLHVILESLENLNGSGNKNV